MNPEKSRTLRDAIPLLVIVCLLPFVVYGHIYEYEGESFGIFLDGKTFCDFFSHTRALIFEVAGLYMLYRLITDHLQGRFKRPCFVMAAGSAVLAACLLISGVLALNSYLAFYGGYQRFEGTFVKLSYLILALYTYQVSGSERLRSAVLKGTIVTSVIECIVGLLQMAGHDPFATGFVQSLILPGELEGSEITNILGDNRVYLTMANPNYASMYLAVMIIIITFSAVFVKKRGYRAGLAVLDVICFAELTATRSRTGVIMLIAAALVWLIISAKSILRVKKKVMLILGMIIMMLAAGIITDRVMDLGMWDRIGYSLRTFGQDHRNCSITYLNTGMQDVEIEYGEKFVAVSFGDIMDTEHLNIRYMKDGDGPDELRFSVEEIDQEPMIVAEEGDTRFYFAYDSELGYMIYAGNGYYDYIDYIPHVDMHGLEPAASGRGYIWSRTLPLIRGMRIVTGYGADNFYLAYPQNDYLGKAQYSSSPYTIIEKPHNTYLLYGVENGVPAMIAFAAMIFALICYCIRKRRNACALLTALLMAAYAAGYFFNDSSIVISPLFWIILGAGYRLTEEDAAV